jgi:hypothetical protein
MGASLPGGDNSIGRSLCERRLGFSICVTVHAGCLNNLLSCRDYTGCSASPSRTHFTRGGGSPTESGHNIGLIRFDTICDGLTMACYGSRTVCYAINRSYFIFGKGNGVLVASIGLMATFAALRKKGLACGSISATTATATTATSTHSTQLFFIFCSSWLGPTTGDVQQ